jgi:hypothetical protein
MTHQSIVIFLMFLHYEYGCGTIFQLHFAADINNSIISQRIKTMIMS